MNLLQATPKKYIDENVLTKFTLGHLQGIFYVYGIALNISLIVFFIELSSKLIPINKKGKRKKKLVQISSK